MIGVIDGGLSHHYDPFVNLPHRVKFIDISKLPTTNLYKYEAIVVPFYTNQVVLKRVYGKLRRYLEYGGILIVLGINADRSKWFKETDLSVSKVNDILLNSDIDEYDRIILNDISKEDLKFHRYFYAHGSMGLPRDSVSLVSDSKTGRSVFYVNRSFFGKKRKGHCGTLLVTTLDPDHHSVNVEWIIDDKKEQERIKNSANHLLSNIITWATSEHDRLGFGVKLKLKAFLLLNYLTGFNLLIILLFMLSILLFSPSLGFLGFPSIIGTYLTERDIDLFANFCSIVSLILAIGLKYAQ